jgi:hypothetical protein
MIWEVEARMRGALLAPLLILAIPGVALAASSTSPRHLIDGSTPPVVPKALAAQDPAFVMTRVRVTTKSRLRPMVSACGGSERVALDSLVVERIGVNGRTITFPIPGSEIGGCDRNPRARPVQNPWCGGAAWILRRGRVSDARLDICTDRKGRPVVAFGWVNALPRAKWIVVDQPGFREVYPVAARLPVRVSTVSEMGSPTTFHTAQYDANGVLLARKVVRASIAS